MKEYNVEVIVTETHTYNYRVEASSQEEAIEKAEIGDTISEDHWGINETISRQAVLGPDNKPVVKRDNT